MTDASCLPSFITHNQAMKTNLLKVFEWIVLVGGIVFITWGIIDTFNYTSPLNAAADSRIIWADRGLVGNGASSFRVYSLILDNGDRVYVFAGADKIAVIK